MTRTQRHFEEVELGSELPSLVKDIWLEQMAMYAAVCWDFNPIHYCSDTCRKLGYPGPAAFADTGMISSFLAQVVTDWMGISGIFKKLGSNQRVMVFPGDRLTCKGKVTDKHTKGDSNLVECEVWIENQKGEKVASGSATVELPSKSRGN